MSVKITIEQKTLERLRQLGGVKESEDTIINRIVDYIEFHPDCWKH